MKVAVVTPTIGNDVLSDCLRGVSEQTYQNLVHYVFIDGQEHSEKTKNIISKFDSDQIKLITLEENIGKGWYGHRVYAACSFLVNADIILYLDEDNWFMPDHVESLVDVIKQGNDWAYSLRKIYNKNGNYLCDDNCESLGKYSTYVNSQAFLIDTSCYAVKRDLAVRIGHAWYGQWGADRQFFAAVRQYFPKFDGTGQHTLCYRLDGNPNSVNQQFFEDGNKVMLQKYNGKYPWVKS